MDGYIYKLYKRSEQGKKGKKKHIQITTVLECLVRTAGIQAHPKGKGKISNHKLHLAIHSVKAGVDNVD